MSLAQRAICHLKRPAYLFQAPLRKLVPGLIAVYLRPFFVLDEAGERASKEVTGGGGGVPDDRRERCETACHLGPESHAVPSKQTIKWRAFRS